MRTGLDSELPHLFSFPLGMTESRSALFRSLHTYVFLLVIPADAVLFCRATHTNKPTLNPRVHACIPSVVDVMETSDPRLKPQQLHKSKWNSWTLNVQQSNDGGHSRSGRWRHLSCGLGCRPCWGCWRCPAEGWREGHLGSPGCRAYGAARRLLPWRCCPPSRSDSSWGEPFLEERSDQLHKTTQERR